MKTIYIRELNTAGSSTDPFEKLAHCMQILRSLLQLVTITAMELADRVTDTDSIELATYAERFKSPPDGLLIEILDNIIPQLRTVIHSRMCQGFFEKINDSQIHLSQGLQNWVEFRNNHPGHGVTDRKTATLWAENTTKLILQSLDVFRELMPEPGENNTLKLKLHKEEYLIDTPMIYNGDAIVIRRIIQRKASSKLQAQTLSLYSSKAVTLDLPNASIFTSEPSFKNSYEIICITNDHSEHIVEHNIPKRQTDTFEGREKEIKKIEQWLNDSDSRRCQIYGDGGLGKTTLLLETLNRYIEGKIKIERMNPMIICYFTAKMTRWSAIELQHLSSIPPMMGECLHELFKCLHLKLDKGVYGASSSQLIAKIETALKSNKLTRNDILLIIDNTETLATDKRKTEELQDLIAEIGKKLCRLIITTRRREAIEAKDIPLEALSIEDSVSLLRRLAEDYGASPILQAGDTRLRKAAEKLMRKPLLLEALVIYISRANIGIEVAMKNLFDKSEESLLEFLYDDAWARLTDIQQQLFFVLVSITTNQNSISIGRACQLIEVQHSEFQRSLSETHFATSTDYGSYYEIELVELARRFFEKKLSQYPREFISHIKDIASQVDSYVAERNLIERDYIEDRVADAFRNEFAKAAKVAVDKRCYKEADELYEMAIQADPTNAALHDRYALFLLNMVKDLNRALTMSLKSLELNQNNCDANVTLAMIHYRFSELEKGDAQIDISRKLGRPEDFCALQKGIARYHLACATSDPAASAELLESAEKFLKFARRYNNPLVPYGAKNSSDISKYQTKVIRRKGESRSQR